MSWAHEPLINGLCHAYSCVAPCWAPLVQAMRQHNCSDALHTAHTSLIARPREADHPKDVANAFVDEFEYAVNGGKGDEEGVASQIADWRSRVATEDVGQSSLEQMCHRYSEASAQLYRSHLGDDWQPGVVSPVSQLTERTDMGWDAYSLRAQRDVGEIHYEVDGAAFDIDRWSALCFALFHEYVSHLHSGWGERQDKGTKARRFSLFHDAVLLGLQKKTYGREVHPPMVQQTAYLELPEHQLARSDNKFANARNAFDRLYDLFSDPLVWERACLRVAAANYDADIDRWLDVHSEFTVTLVTIANRLDVMITTQMTREERCSLVSVLEESLKEAQTAVGVLDRMESFLDNCR
jgi:hypothetical protein